MYIGGYRSAGLIPAATAGNAGAFPSAVRARAHPALAIAPMIAFSVALGRIAAVASASSGW